MSNNTSNKSIAPMTILGIDTDVALDITNAAAARRKQIALGALTLYHEWRSIWAGCEAGTRPGRVLRVFKALERNFRARATAGVGA